MNTSYAPTVNRDCCGDLAISAAPRTPAIVLSTDRLQYISSQLIERVNEIEVHLSAVLGPQGPTSADSNTKMEGPPLACCVHEACDRIEVAVERLRGLNSRIEL
jgi:hypothetical protein